MTLINPNWDTSWTTTSINATSIAGGSSATTASISNDNKSGTEISLTLVNDLGTAETVSIYVLRDIDGTNYQTSTDNPWGFTVFVLGPSTTTIRKSFIVPGDKVSNFKIMVAPAATHPIIATVRYKQFTIDIV